MAKFDSNYFLLQFPNENIDHYILRQFLQFYVPIYLYKFLYYLNNN